VAGTATSNSTAVVVPPQVMIQTLVGEARGQTAQGDNTMPAILLVAENRFWDTAFRDAAPGCTGLNPTNWQNTLVPCQFQGLYDPTAAATTNGAEPELDYAASVFAGTTTVSIPAGCESYWSPTNGQVATLQLWASDPARYPANILQNADWKSVGASSSTWAGQPRQAVIKGSVGGSTRGGSGPTGYASAPAIVLFRRAPNPGDPAVITITP
jgi:hypothetical protein